MYWVKKLIGIGLFMLVSYSVLITNTGSSLTLSDSNRKALVIGNANYPKRGKFVPLPNPLNNAQAIAQRLREYGFSVTKVIDVNSIAMKDAIDTFTNSLNIDDVALVYFSGHGIVTTCYRGEEQQNFLIPVQPVFRGKKADICKDAVPAQWLINLLNERNGGTNILLLDTCRNLLLEDQGTDNSGEMVTMKSAGTFIGYASAPGKTSKGDEESAYSVFTEQFLEKLSYPHDALPLELLFKDVRTAVTTKAEELGFEQVPWDDNGLVGENFCFRIPCKKFVSPADTDEKLRQERQEKERLEAENKQLQAQLDAANAKIKEMPIESSKSVVVNYPPRQAFEPEMVNIPAGELISGRYQDNGDGTVTDTTTNLMWKRCSEGQTWTGSTCAGEAIGMTWNDAMPNEQQKSWASFAGRSDWRMPSREELRSLVYCSSGKPKTWNDTGDGCEDEHEIPAIDQIAFPNTPPDWFWTATPDTHACCSWVVRFDGGHVNGHDRGDDYFVRCVRAGQ